MTKKKQKRTIKNPKPQTPDFSKLKNQTLTLESTPPPPPPPPPPVDLDHDHHQQQQEQQDQGKDSSSPDLISPRTSQFDRILQTYTKKPKSNVKPMHPQVRYASEKKLMILKQHFKPIPFVPTKTLDFSKHEGLLKRLELWDFVNIEFDMSLRSDLLEQLISCYNHQQKRSLVDEVRVKLSRADLAKSLRLPSKKHKVDDDAEVVSDEEGLFMEEFMLKWMILHDDSWVMPEEVLNWVRFVKEKQPGNVDWSGLIWFMVEKELLKGTELVNCYYASHLQCLIRFQKPDLFVEEGLNVVIDMEAEAEAVVNVQAEVVTVEAKEEVGHGVVNDAEKADVGDGNVGFAKEEEAVVVEEEGKVEKVVDEGEGGAEEEAKVSDAKEEEGVDEKMSETKEEEGVDRKVPDAEEAAVDAMTSGAKKEEMIGHDGGLELKNQEEEVRFKREEIQHIGGENVMDLDECEEEEEEEEHEQEHQVSWLLQGRNNTGEHFLQRCDLYEVGGSSFQHERKMEAEEEENYEVKCPPIEELSSMDMVQQMGTMNIPCSRHAGFIDQSSEELYAPRVDTHMSMGGPSMYGNSLKREIDDGNDAYHLSLGDHRKRLRNEDSWEPKSDFDMCMEQMQNSMEKARMLYLAKERAAIDAPVNHQILLDKLAQQDSVIQHIERTTCEETRKYDEQIYHLERELRLMGTLLDGYRKALKETRRSFAKYRERSQQPEEPLYVDVPGSGGLVISRNALEKQQLQKAEEDRMNRLMFETQIHDFTVPWFRKLEACVGIVDSLGDKVSNLATEVKVLKENVTKSKVSEACLHDDDNNNNDNQE